MRPAMIGAILCSLSVNDKAVIHLPQGEGFRMLKLTVAVLAIALAGTASADEWSSLRIDASSNAAFERFALTAFTRRVVAQSNVRRSGEWHSRNIWLAGTEAAETGGGPGTGQRTTIGRSTA